MKAGIEKSENEFVFWIEIKRKWKAPQSVPRRIKGHRDVAKLLFNEISGLDHEQSFVVTVDPMDNLLFVQTLGAGTELETPVSIKRLQRHLLLSDAFRFYLVHNHTVEKPQPSPQDVSFTRVIQEKAAAVDCPMVDHLVMCASGSYSSIAEWVGAGVSAVKQSEAIHMLPRTFIDENVAQETPENRAAMDERVDSYRTTNWRELF